MVWNYVRGSVACIMGYIIPPILDWGVWRGTPLEVVCNNHSPAPIYGGYLPPTCVYCGTCCVPGAVSACCTYQCMFVVLEAYLVLSVLAALSNVCLWFLKHTWCCQCLLHLSMYVCGT